MKELVFHREEKIKVTGTFNKVELGDALKRRYSGSAEVVSIVQVSSYAVVTLWIFDGSQVLEGGRG